MALSNRLKSPLSVEKLQMLQDDINAGGVFREPGQFANLTLGLQDDCREYTLIVGNGKIVNIGVNIPHLAQSTDITIQASDSVWAQYLTEKPPPPYADLFAMLIEKTVSITGNAEKFWQNITFIDYMMRQMGHREPLVPLEPKVCKSNTLAYRHGSIEEVIGRYVHLHVDGHDYRVFFEESGSEDGIPVVLLHAANSDARMWHHQLSDPDLKSHFRMYAFDMPWHARSIPPPELIRHGYKLTNDFYGRIIREFCDALHLNRPILIGSNMGGDIQFHCAYHDPDRYRAFIAIAARDFEPRRWMMERIYRHPAINFNRVLASTTHDSMAPTTSSNNADEVAWMHETGSPRALRGDLAFTSHDSDARPFMGRIDTARTPFYLLAGDYDWSCTETHTNAIRERMPGVNVVRMKGLGQHPAGENPELFKSYLVPVLEDVLRRTEMIKREGCSGSDSGSGWSNGESSWR